MATIGLDKLFYAEIIEDSDGNETYGVPASLAKAFRQTSPLSLRKLLSTPMTALPKSSRSSKAVRFPLALTI